MSLVNSVVGGGGECVQWFDDKDEYIANAEHIDAIN